MHELTPLMIDKNGYQELEMDCRVDFLLKNWKLTTRYLTPIQISPKVAPNLGATPNITPPLRYTQ